MLGQRLITLEGGEGAGKSSALQAVRDWFDARGLPLWCSREPGGTELGEELRQLILRPRNEAVTALSELFMVFAARAPHLQQEVLPRLQAGTWVVLDRFSDASYAYQGGGRGIASDRIAELERWVQGDLRPGLVLWLDVPIAIGLARAAQRSEAADRIGSESEDFMRRVQAVYAERCRQHASHHRIDAAQPMAAVRADLLRQLARHVATVCP